MLKYMSPLKVLQMLHFVMKGNEKTFRQACPYLKSFRWFRIIYQHLLWAYYVLHFWVLPPPHSVYFRFYIILKKILGDFFWKVWWNLEARTVELPSPMSQNTAILTGLTDFRTQVLNLSLFDLPIKNKVVYHIKNKITSFFL